MPALRPMMLTFGLTRLLVVIALVPFAVDWRSPTLASVRPWGLVALIVVPLSVACFEMWNGRPDQPENDLSGALRQTTLITSLLVLLATLGLEGRFHWIRRQVLAADPQQLEVLGRHVLVGFRDRAELSALVERRAIAGVFLAPRNVMGKDVEQIRREIDDLQDVRRRQGLPPLLIAADQEGGVVSRLSPPLTRLPALAELVASNPDPAQRRAAVQQYAAIQGKELAALGVNLNFAPVVDLNFNLRVSNDRFTHIGRRAIASDPNIVRDVAADYCTALRNAGVLCTLKHFPGLGRVAGDTHRSGADLIASRAQLAAADWVPFRALMEGGAVTMLSHARLVAVDRDHPASFSAAVVDIVRREWGYDGALITDDFSMGAVHESPQGIVGGAVAALNAGVDLILISFDTDQYFAIMQGLLQATAGGALSIPDLAASDRRLARIHDRIR